jgi:hypothetical protein
MPATRSLTLGRKAPRFPQNTGVPDVRNRASAQVSYAFLVGTGMPAILTVTDPRWFRLVK